MIRLLTGLLVIAAVHGITSFMVTWLPNAAVIALGILGGNAASVESYWQARDPVSYPEQVMRLLRGDMGNTLDHSSVLNELSGAAAQTAPSLMIGVGVALALSMLALNADGPTRRRIGTVADTASLLPPFVFPFLIAPILFATSYAGSSVAARLALIASIVAPVTIMTSAMMLRFYNDATDEHYGSKLALNGLASPSIQRLGRLSAQFRILALSDRIMVAALVSILLAEPLLGLSGIGTLSARAIRTADPNLTVAISTAIAVVVVSFGVLSAWLKPAFEALSSSR